MPKIRKKESVWRWLVDISSWDASPKESILISLLPPYECPHVNKHGCKLAPLNLSCEFMCGISSLMKNVSYCSNYIMLERRVLSQTIRKYLELIVSINIFHFHVARTISESFIWLFDVFEKSSWDIFSLFLIRYQLACWYLLANKNDVIMCFMSCHILKIIL